MKEKQCPFHFDSIPHGMIKLPGQEKLGFHYELIFHNSQNTRKWSEHICWKWLKLESGRLFLKNSLRLKNLKQFSTPVLG